LNGTYLWYGSKTDRYKCAENQVAQDNNASGLSTSVAASRAATKANGCYSNTGRDLVDAKKADADILAKLKEEDLPESMKKMTAAEREKCISDAAAKRAEIQKKINELTAEREKYLAEQRKLEAKDADKDTLGDAVVTTVRKQLVKSGFENE
jgi:hypothetical protein